MRSILVAADSLAGAELVVRTAAWMAGRTGATLHVLSVDGSRTEAVSATIVSALAGFSAPWTMEIVDRPLREAVLSRCEEVPDDLVVLAASTEDRPVDGEIVSIALRVPGSVLVVRGPVRLPPWKVLLPVGDVDLREGTLFRALDWLAALQPARSASSEPQPPPTILQVLRLTTGERSVRDLIPEFEQHLETLDARLVDDAGVQIRRRFEPIPVGRERSLRWVEHENADLVVLRRHEVALTSPTSQELAWLHFLLAARTATLLLPREVASPRGIAAGPIVTGCAG